MQNHQDHAQRLILALDVGGTFIKSGIFAGDRLTELPQIPSCSAGTAEEILSALRAAVDAGGQVDGVAMAIPGPFDYRNGISRMAHKFGAIQGLNLRHALNLPIPLAFVHDVNAFLLGELHCGSLRGIGRAGGVTLGTGLGAAAAVDGEPLTNELGAPASGVALWNQPYRGGTAEDFVSTRALLKKYPAPTVRELAQYAKNGDGRAQRVWAEFGADLAALLTKWIDALRLEKVVLGGQITRDYGLFAEPLAGLPVEISHLSGSALYGVWMAALRHWSH